MNVSQAISSANSYMSNNISYIEKLYAKITKSYLDIKKHPETDNKFLKADTKKDIKKINDLFEASKKGRDSFIASVTLLRENKSDEDVKLGCSCFLRYDDILASHRKRVDKSLKLMEDYEDSLNDKVESYDEDNLQDKKLAFNYKRIQVTNIKNQCERLLKLVESNIKFIDELTSIYE